MKVLATGATGQYGHHVVTALVAHGIDVRGVVHDPAKADEASSAGAAETVQVDLADTDGVAEALLGVEGVFLITPAFHPDATVMALNVVAAAVDVGVEKLVYNGVYHPSLSLPNHAGTRPVEEALYTSNLDFTVLQPAMYIQALEATYRSALETGAVVAPWSKHSKMTYVDYRDVAEVAALAFVDPRLSRGTFELAAGGMVDRVEIAEMMSRWRGARCGPRTPTTSLQGPRAWPRCSSITTGMDFTGAIRLFCKPFCSANHAQLPNSSPSLRSNTQAANQGFRRRTSAYERKIQHACPRFRQPARRRPGRPGTAGVEHCGLDGWGDCDLARNDRRERIQGSGDRGCTSSNRCRTRCPVATAPRPHPDTFHT